MAELERNEKRFSTIFKQNPAWIVLTHAESGKTLEVNKAWEELTGYSREEAVGRTVVELGIYDEPTWKTIINEVKAKGYVRNQETVSRNKNGELQTLLASRELIEVQGETHLLSMGVDITERKRYEEELRESEAFLRTMFESVPEGIKILSADGTILQINHTGMTLTEADSLDQVIGKSIYDIIVPEDREKFRSLIKSVYQGKKEMVEFEIIGLKGSRKNLETHAAPLYTTTGEIIGVLSVERDITERKKLELQLLRAQRLESLGTLASGVAHDLNNILSPITLAAQLLKKSVKGEKDISLINSIVMSAQRGADVVKQVLTFARGTEGGRSLLQSKYIVAEIEKIIKETFPRNITIKTDMPSNLWVINANSTQIHQVLMNLCVNARDAMPKGGTLSIKAENIILDEYFVHKYKGSAPGPHLVISVSDTGTGIPKELLPKIFDPFFTTKGIEQGTGLGLSTVYGIVKSHGGFINVYSEENKGTTFKVYIPAVLTEEDRAEQAAEEQIPAGNNETILVVDDEEALKEMLRASLEMFNYNVMTASDGAEAVALFVEHRHSIAAIVTDMMMPYMDGEAMIRAVHKIDPNVKIIATSGLTSGKNPEEAGIKVHAFVQKPYTTQQLLKTLRNVLAAQS